MRHIFWLRLLRLISYIKNKCQHISLVCDEEEQLEEVRVKPQTLDGVVPTQVAHFLSQQQTERRGERAEQRRREEM